MDNVRSECEAINLDRECEIAIGMGEGENVDIRKYLENATDDLENTAVDSKTFKINLHMCNFYMKSELCE